jgi:hypothetical protein
MEIVSLTPTHPLLEVSYSFEFSNCARTAIMFRVSEDVAKSRVGKKCAVWSGVAKSELADATETKTVI